MQEMFEIICLALQMDFHGIWFLRFNISPLVTQFVLEIIII